MPKERQTSFAAGEWAPTLWGRTDQQRYGSAARLLRNYLITPHGAAASRPGFQLRHLFAGGTGKVRLISYRMRDDSAALLVFKENYVGYFADVAGVLTEVDSLVTTYVEADLSELRMAQMGDVFTVVHKNHAPAELWFDGTILHLEDITFGVDAFQMGLGWTPFVSQVALPTPSVTEPARLWKWQVTRLVREGATGRIFESLPTTITFGLFGTVRMWVSETKYDNADPVYYQGFMWASQQDNNTGHNPLTDDGTWWVSLGTVQAHFDAHPEFKYDLPESIAVYPDKTIRISMLTKDDAALELTVVGHNVYRGQEGYFGLVGYTKGQYFIDEGQDPNFNISPPQGTNPFEIKAADVLLRTENPTEVCFFEGRRYFAATTERPEMVWGSAVSQFRCFDEAVQPDDEAALAFELGSKQLETIRALLPRRELLAMTASSEWILSGAGGGLLTARSIAAHQQTEHGCGNLAPLVMGDTVLFVQRKGTVPRALLFSQEAGGYQSSDLSIFARHFFDGKKLAAWAWVEDPFSVVWVARTDGSLFSLTYIREQELTAWSRHTLGGGGLVESLASLPEGQEDALYAVINRGGVRSIERLASRLFTMLADAVCLDGSITYSGVAATVVTGLGHLEGQEVYALADGNVVGPRTVLGGQIDISADIPDGASKIHVGLRYDCDFEPLDLAPEKGRQKKVARVWLEYTGRVGGSVADSEDGAAEDACERLVDEGYDDLELREWGLLEVPLPSTWEQRGRVFVRQSDPLPITLLSLMRDYELGG